MNPKILVTGAAGYIGGSLIAEFVSNSDGPLSTAVINGAVRTEEQAQKLSKLNINTIVLDLHNAAAVSEAVLRNEFDIIVNTASSSDDQIARNLINALGERRKISNQGAFFIHSSVSQLFTPESGWQFGEARDTDNLVEKQRDMPRSHPLVATNLAVVDEAEAKGITSFNVMVPNIYGRGSGEWRKLSVNIPNYVRISIAKGVVYKFDKDARTPAAHIADLVDLYTLLVEKILRDEPIPSGEHGNYFAIAHRASWWAIMQRIADSLRARRLLKDSEIQVWPSYEVASETLGYPLSHIRAMCTSGGEHVPINAHQLGWRPKWTEERFLANMDDEVQAVLDLDTVKTTLFDNLK